MTGWKGSFMLLELKNVSKTFVIKKERHEVLKDISLKIENGDFVALTGESGAGKTTLLGIISLNDTYTGELLIDGKNVSLMGDSEKSAIKNQKIGILCQNYNLFPELTIRENIMLPLEYAAKNTVHYSCDELAEFLGIKDLLDKYPGTLSGGERQRAALARALICSPELLIADEPTRNLDNENAAKLMELFKKLAKKGISVIISTHDKDIACYAKKHIALDNGEIQEYSTNENYNDVINEENNQFLQQKEKKTDGKSHVSIKNRIKNTFGFVLRHKVKAILTLLLCTFTVTTCLVFYAIYIGGGIEDRANGKYDKNPKNIAGNIMECEIKEKEKKFTLDDVLSAFPQERLERISYVKKITFPKDYKIKGSNGIDLPAGIDVFTYPEWLFNANMRFHRDLDKGISIMNESTAIFTKDAYESLSGLTHNLRERINIGNKSLLVIDPFEKDEIFYHYFIVGKALLLPENSISDIPHEEKKIILAIQTKGEDLEQEYEVAFNNLIQMNDGESPDIEFFSWNFIRKHMGYIIIFIKTLLAVLFGVPLVLCGLVLLSLMMSGLKEKTREIAIKKIFGLDNAGTFIGCIKETFALTAACCVLGGTIGIILGYFLLSDIKESIPCAGVAESISGIFIPKAFLLTFGIIILMSLLAGIIPAIKSARISPMEALKE